MQKYLTINIPVIPLIAVISVFSFIVSGLIIHERKEEARQHTETQCYRYCMAVWDTAQSHYDVKDMGICQCGWGTSQVGHVHGIEYYSIDEVDYETE